MPRAAAALHLPVEHRGRLFKTVRADEMREGFAQRLFLGIAQRRAHRRVARRHPLFEIGGEDIVVRLLEDGADAPLAFLERGFGVLSFCDVERDAQQPRPLLAAIAEAAAIALQPTLLALPGAEDALFAVQRPAPRPAPIPPTAAH